MDRPEVRVDLAPTHQCQLTVCEFREKGSRTLRPTLGCQGIHPKSSDCVLILFPEEMDHREHWPSRVVFGVVMGSCSPHHAVGAPTSDWYSCSSLSFWVVRRPTLTFQSAGSTSHSTRSPSGSSSTDVSSPSVNPFNSCSSSLSLLAVAGFSTHSFLRYLFYTVLLVLQAH